LSRQASAPTLAPAGPGGGFSFDSSFARGSPQPGAGHDPFARSPGMRRAASSSSIGMRGPGGGGGGAASSSQQRPGSTASVPRQRPYDIGGTQAPPQQQQQQQQQQHYGTPERDARRFHPAAAPMALPPPGGGGPPHGSYGNATAAQLQHRGEALQLESRLTEKLREHSIMTSDQSRRPGSAAGGRRPAAPMQQWPASPWPDDSFMSGPGQQSMDQRQHSSYASFDPRSTPSPAGMPGRGPGGVWPDRRPLTQSPSVPLMPQSQHPQSQQSQSHQSQSRLTASPYAGSSGVVGEDMGQMPMSRLKIYSDLFEEVIERDRVFGTLLRKIKTAYDMLLLRPEQEAAVPHHGPGFGPPPGQGGGQWEQVPYGGTPSNEPTQRVEQNSGDWEMHRENRVLKDLVERLHLELEEAVKREHKWKQKVGKLKARVESANNSQVFHHSHAQHYPPEDEPWPYQHQQGVSPSHQAGLPPQMMGLPPQMMGAHPQMMGAHPGHGQRGFQSNFNANRREPLGGSGEMMEGPDGQATLNQGGLLSMSSISPQTSAPIMQESAVDRTQLTAVDDSGSDDSGRLPQRPDRRKVIKPPHVPRLDLNRMKQRLAEMEEEEEEEPVGDEILDGPEMDEEREEEMMAYDAATRGGDLRYYDPNEQSESGSEEGRDVYPQLREPSIVDFLV